MLRQINGQTSRLQDCLKGRLCSRNKGTESVRLRKKKRAFEGIRLTPQLRLRAREEGQPRRRRRRREPSLLEKVILFYCFSVLLSKTRSLPLKSNQGKDLEKRMKAVEGPLVTRCTSASTPSLPPFSLSQLVIRSSSKRKGRREAVQHNHSSCGVDPLDRRGSA